MRLEGASLFGKGFRDLTVKVPRHKALPQQLNTVHLRLDAASAVMVFHDFAFLPGGITAWTPRSAIASWHFRVSYAPSAVALLVCRDLFKKVG